MSESDGKCRVHTTKTTSLINERAKNMITFRNAEFKGLFNDWCEILQKAGNISREYTNNLEKISRGYQTRKIRSVELNGLNCSVVTLGENQSSYIRPFVEYSMEEVTPLVEVFPSLCDCLVSSCCNVLTKFQNYLVKASEQHTKCLSTYIASHNKSVKENSKLVKRMDRKSFSDKSTQSKMTASLRSIREEYYNYALFMRETAIINQGLHYFANHLFGDIIYMSDAGLQVLFNTFFQGLIGVLDIQSAKIPPYSSLLSAIFTVFSMEEDQGFYSGAILQCYSQCALKNVCRFPIKKNKVLSDEENEFLEKFGDIVIQQKEKLVKCREAVDNMKTLKEMKESIEEIIIGGHEKKSHWKGLKPRIVPVLTEFEERIMATVRLREAEISATFFSAIVIDVNSQSSVAFLNGDASVKYEEKIFPMGGWARECVIFGGSIEAHCKNCGSEISPIVLFCTEKIESMDLATEGIFRLAGRQRQIKKIKHLMEAGYYYLNSGLFEYCDILKWYIRDLDEPLIPDDVLGLLEREVPKENIRNIKQIIGSMPAVKRKNLHYLCIFLEKVSALSDKNKMTRANLALLFATNLNNKIANILDNNSIKVVYLLLAHSREIFTEKLDEVPKICPSLYDIDKDETFEAVTERKPTKLELFDETLIEEYKADDSDQEESGGLDLFINPLDEEETKIEGPTPHYVFELAWLPAHAELNNRGAKFVLDEEWFKGWRISGFSLYEGEKKPQKQIQVEELESLRQDLEKYFMFDPIKNPRNEFDPQNLQAMWDNSAGFDGIDKYVEKCLQLRSQFDVDGILTKASVTPSNLLFYMRNAVVKALHDALGITPRLILEKTLLLKIQIFMKADLSLMDSPYDDKNEPLRFSI